MTRTYIPIPKEATPDEIVEIIREAAAEQETISPSPEGSPDGDN